MTFIMYSKQNNKDCKNSFRDSTIGFKHLFLQILTGFAFKKQTDVKK